MEKPEEKKTIVYRLVLTGGKFMFKILMIFIGGTVK